jgi:hypothetical protein
MPLYLVRYKYVPDDFVVKLIWLFSPEQHRREVALSSSEMMTFVLELRQLPVEGFAEKNGCTVKSPLHLSNDSWRIDK